MVRIGGKGRYQRTHGEVCIASYLRNDGCGASCPSLTMQEWDLPDSPTAESSDAHRRGATVQHIRT